ncbi:hypothetical protein ACFLW2_01290 [Chloroflexota bacterium]
MEREKFGVYLNIKDLKVVRINSPYWIPTGDEWVFVTPEVNATLLNIRETVKQKGLGVEPDKIVWGGVNEYKK